MILVGSYPFGRVESPKWGLTGVMEPISGHVNFQRLILGSVPNCFDRTGQVF